MNYDFLTFFNTVFFVNTEVIPRGQNSCVDFLNFFYLVQRRNLKKKMEKYRNISRFIHCFVIIFIL